LALFKIWKSSGKKESKSSEETTPEKTGAAFSGEKEPPETIENRLEGEVLRTKRNAALKEHRYRAGVINFITVVRDDLEGVNETNYRSLVSMTVATLTNFINVAQEENIKLAQWLEEHR
jgi:hypothetical protein